ncbi:MAG: phospho-N-acetylmuramoyl-pentapeptide-transferase [Clostridia bacterium]
MEKYVAVFTAIVAFVSIIIITPKLIPILFKLKVGQQVRSDGPETHLIKAGTPTMGGIAFLFSAIIGVITYSIIVKPNIWLVITFLLIFLGYGAIGFLDDYMKVVKKNTKGLSAKYKFSLQIGLAIITAILLIKVINLSTDVYIAPIFVLNMGLYYIFFIIFIFTAITNAINFTDGLDGLAVGALSMTYLTYAIIATIQQQYILVTFALVLFSSCLGFLFFNKYPAKIFMGDTGSLALGAGVAMLAVLTKTEILFLVIGALYVLEVLSVIIQVCYFKMTKGKRFFLMAPLHHHFEKKGWKETKVVIVFTIVSGIAGLLGILLYTLLY